MMDSLLAELILLRKRRALWILLSVWSFMALMFSYLLPYYAYTSDLGFHGISQILLLVLLPQSFVTNVLQGFPFFGGVFALILGALTMGSEYTWGTLTPVFTQKASRLRVFFSKMIALIIALIPFVLLVFFLGVLASTLIGLREGQSLSLPPLWEILRAMGTSWFILAVWSSFGVLLAVLFRGTALAIGLGIIYGLVLENIISGFGRQIELLEQISKGLLRTNGYSLVSSIGVSVQGEQGPGAFAGPFVSGTESLLFLVSYIVLFLGVSAWLVRWRDVAGSS